MGQVTFKNPRIIGVMPFYNGAELAKISLRSAFDYLWDIPIIIGDDGSKESERKDLAQWIVESKRPDLVFASWQHQGVHGAFETILRLAMQQEGCEWILFWGSDCEFTQEDTIKIWMQEIDLLASRYCTASNMGEFAAIHATIYQDTNVVQWCGSYDGRELGVKKQYGVSGQLRINQLLHTKPTPWLPHTAVLLKVSALRKVIDIYGSIYNHDYKIYCGDRDLCYRLRAIGYQCGVASRVAVHHHHYGGQSVGKAFNYDDRMFWLWHDETLLYQTWNDMIHSGDASVGDAKEDAKEGEAKTNES